MELLQDGFVNNMNNRHLSSLQNPSIKQIIHLRERQERDKTALFLIEGYREILRAVQGGWKIDQLFICSDLFLGSNEKALIHQLESSGTLLTTTTDTVFKKFSYRDRPDGLLAIAPQKKITFSDLNQYKSPSTPFFVVAEAIEKPGNLGTILRSSDAVGVSGLIVCDKCTDIFNPNVVRASVGTLFSVPTIESSSEETIEWLRTNQIKILAATPHATHTFTEVDLTGPIAIAVGTEQLGLSQRWLQQADLQVKIPMKGMADSLNVAMATTLLLYEVDRQRQQGLK